MISATEKIKKIGGGEWGVRRAANLMEGILYQFMITLPAAP